jgi:DNA-binding transcriptional ArsR family regulator
MTPVRRAISGTPTTPPLAHKTLTSTREVSAYLHRTRMSILAALGAGPATVSQIAASMSVHPANLTRHVRILEDAGLVALHEKRDTGRNLEKYYQAAAHTFDVAPDADALTAPHRIALAMARSELSAALARLPDKSPGAVQVVSIGARLLPGRQRAFLGALTRLAADFEAANNTGGVAFRMTLAMYPDQAPDAQNPTRVVLSHKAGADEQLEDLPNEGRGSRARRRLGGRRARTG